MAERKLDIIERKASKGEKKYKERKKR